MNQKSQKNKVEMRIIAIIFTALISVSVFAENPSYVADTQSFGVRLFLVPDSDSFVEMWSKPETPKLTIFNKVPIDTEFAAVILYWGGGKSKDGSCNIHLRTTVLEGSEVLASGDFFPVCEKHAPPNPGVLALADTIIDLKATGEPTNLVVQVEITDNINNEILVVSAPIEVIK